MARRGPKPATAPLCAHCDRPAALASGRDIYPHRPDLYDRTMWQCVPCRAHVGCHRGGRGDRALGRPANLELRGARAQLHERRVDPLWKTAADSGVYEPDSRKAGHIIRSAARRRVYAFLAARMGLEVDACHIGEFSIEQCREAWRQLRGVAYPEIRDWWRRQRVAELLAGSPTAAEIRHACFDHCEGCRLIWTLKDGAHPIPPGQTWWSVTTEAPRPCEATELRAALTERLEQGGDAGATPPEPATQEA